VAKKKKKKRKKTPEEIVAPLRPHQWKPGQSGNMEGGRAHNPELRRIKGLSKDELAIVGSMIVENDYSEIERIAETKRGSGLQVWVATMVVEAVNKKSGTKMDAVLDRLIGPVERNMKISSPDGSGINLNVTAQTREERDRRREELRALREKAGDD
jgi:hypothetical protein